MEDSLKKLKNAGSENWFKIVQCDFKKEIEFCFNSTIELIVKSLRVLPTELIILYEKYNALESD